MSYTLTVADALLHVFDHRDKTNELLRTINFKIKFSKRNLFNYYEAFIVDKNLNQDFQSAEYKWSIFNDNKSMIILSDILSN